MLFERPLAVGHIQFDRHGLVLATTGGYRGNGIRLWSCSDWKCEGVLKGHRQRPSAIAFAGDSDVVVSGSLDRTVRCWNCQTQQTSATHSLHSKAVCSVACSSDGTVAASGGQDGRVFLWRLGSAEDAMMLSEVRGSVNSLAFSPKDRILVGGGGIERQLSEIHIWDLDARMLITALQAHKDWVLWVGFSADGSVLASGSYGEICIWDTATWELLHILKRPTNERFSTVAFAFSSQKDLFISGAWSHAQRRSEVRDRQGNQLGWNVTSSGLVQLWDMASGALADCLEVHSDALRSLSYCPKTELLATGGKEGTVKIWSLTQLRWVL